MTCYTPLLVACIIIPGNCLMYHVRASTGELIVMVYQDLFNLFHITDNNIELATNVESIYEQHRLFLIIIASTFNIESPSGVTSLVLVLYILTQRWSHISSVPPPESCSSSTFHRATVSRIDA